MAVRDDVPLALVGLVLSVVRSTLRSTSAPTVPGSAVVVGASALGGALFTGGQLESSLVLKPRKTQRPQVGALEPDAASEKATTGASLVRRKVGQVRRGTSDVGVASGCTTVFARLRGGGKILAAKFTLLDVKLWMTGASLTKKAELLAAVLWCSLLCTPFTTCLQKGGKCCS